MEEKFQFKKKFGQNFLQDNNILNNIVALANITPNDLVIEIGPGGGALTSKLIERTNKLICFEIDTDLKDHLKQFENKGAKIIYGDFLKQDVNEVIKDCEYDNLYIIANLPYYITTPIITKIIESKLPVKKCVFMVQKEVANRLSATTSTKDYNSLTIFINYYFSCKKAFDVSKNVFYPKPNVDSAIIELDKRDSPLVDVIDENKFFKLVKDSFVFKRKTLRNNLKGYNLIKIEEILKKYGYDLSVRAEALSINVFADISNNI